MELPAIVSLPDDIAKDVMSFVPYSRSAHPDCTTLLHLDHRSIPDLPARHVRTKALVGTVRGHFASAEASPTVHLPGEPLLSAGVDAGQPYPEVRVRMDVETARSASRAMRLLAYALLAAVVAATAATPAQAAYRCPITPTWGRLAAAYGDRKPVGGGTNRHRGIDIAAPRGMPVLATMDGVVRYAGPFGSYGVVVYLEHSGGWSSLYAHLERVAVRPGQRVRCGQTVGFVGSTGRSTGPHLHFELRYRGYPVNPLPYLWAAWMRR